MNWRVVATLRRGVLAVPEALPAEESQRVQQAYEMEQRFGNSGYRSGMMCTEPRGGRSFAAVERAG
ncbi:MAG TPA: hypothetical protein VM554_12995 [Acidisarcina sp.]|nr:hypothetical protein [Acidisarcina sp.]